MANWPATRPTLTIGDAAANVMTTAICRKTRKKSRMLSAGMLAEAFSAIAALEQEGLAGGGAAQRALQFARLARKDERRIARELALGLRQRAEVPIDRRLLDRLRPPAVGGPTLVRHSKRLGHSSGSGLLTGKLSLYKPTPNGDMPFFSGGLEEIWDGGRLGGRKTFKTMAPKP